LKLMNLFSFKHWSLKARVSVLVALPLICITLLTTYNVSRAINRENVSLQNQGEKLLSLAANASQLALFAGDIASLNTLRSAMMNDPQISNVFFYDENKKLLTQPLKNGLSVASETITEKQSFFDNNNYIEGDYWYFIKSVQLSEDLLEGDPEQYVGTQDTSTLGWVILVVDLSDSHAYQVTLLTNNLFLALLMLSAALWLAFRFSHAIVDPLTTITLAVGRYGREDFNQRVDEVSSGELGALEKGINKLAAQVGQSQEVLKKAVEKATLNLEARNIDLAEAKEIADAANMAKDDFLARMSHELRTPLTGIIGFTRLLAKTDQLELRQEYSDMIETSSSVLLTTINDILDFSKLQANSFSLHPIQFNLEDCLRDVLDLHRVAAFEKAIELNMLIDSDTPIEIFADIDKLKKVLNNVIGNAVKFTPSGDIVMFVSLVEKKEDEALISITVKDSGLGISANNIKHLFNPFYQSDETNTRNHGGTGLGLAIAEDFVTLMGGDISISSEDNEGCEVEFSFRCQTVLDACDKPANPEAFQAAIFDNNAWTRRSWRNQILKYTDDVRAPTSFDDLIATLNPKLELLLLGINFQDNNTQSVESYLTRIRAEYTGSIILAVAEDGSALFDSLAVQFKPLVLISKPLTNNRLVSAIEKVNKKLLSEVHPSSLQHQPHKPMPFSDAGSIAGLKILIADDNRFNQVLLTRLIAAGARVTLANDGLAALQLCKESTYDALILDLHMPGLSGLQLSSAIRTTEDCINTDTPIILLTADVRLQQNSESLAAGANAISYKPIDENDLINKLCSLTGQTTQSSQEAKRALLKLSASELSEEVTRQLALIENALSSADLVALEDQVHQLSGVIGLSGLEGINDFVQSLHAAVLTGELSAINVCLERLLSVWNHRDAPAQI